MVAFGFKVDERTFIMARVVVVDVVIVEVIKVGPPVELRRSRQFRRGHCSVKTGTGVDVPSARGCIGQRG